MIAAFAPYGDYRILNGSPANDSLNGVASNASLAQAIPALLSDRIRVPRLRQWDRLVVGAYEGAQSVPVCGQ